MLALGILLIAAGFCVLYGASPKTAFRHASLVRWAQAHRSQARMLGWLLLFLASVVMVRHYGWGTGIYFVFLLFTLLFGVATLLVPSFIGHRR
jgi:hypothetical protein